MITLHEKIQEYRHNLIMRLRGCISYYVHIRYMRSPLYDLPHNIQSKSLWNANVDYHIYFE